MRFTVTKYEFPRGHFTWWIEDSDPRGRKRGPFTSERIATRIANDPQETYEYEHEEA